MEVLHLPGGNEKQEAQRSKGCGPGSEYEAAAIVSMLVAVNRQVVVALAGSRISHQHKRRQAERPHKGSIHELVPNQINCKDASAQAAGWTLKNVWLRLLQAQTKSKGRRSDQVRPENLKRREREDCDIAFILEGQSDQEEDDLSKVRGE